MHKLWVHHRCYPVLVAGLALLLAIGCALPAHASSEHISNFSYDAKLSSDGRLSIVEDLEVNYESTPHHGIYRDIPVSLKSRNGEKYNYKLAVGRVEDSTGRAYQVSRSRVNGYERLKIGDPDKYLTGVNRYVIHYSLSPVVVTDGQVDRLIMEVTGTGWDWPIDRAQASLTLPAGITATDSKCYAGDIGSAEQTCTITASGNQVMVRQDEVLQPGQGLTYDLKLPARSVTNYLVPTQPLPMQYRLGVAGLALLSALATYGYLLVTWWSDYSRRRRQVVIPYYDAPDDLLPAQLGLLRTGVVDQAELTATILDLAVRGYLKIEQTRPQSIFRKAEYSFTKLKSDDGLAAHEKIIFDALFTQGDNVVLSKLNRISMSSAVEKFKSQLGEDLKHKGYYKGSPSNKLGPVAIALVGGGLAASMAIFHPDVSVLSWGVLGGFAGIIAGGLVARYRPRPTQVGAEQWAKVQGFKWFLQVTEAERLKFHDAPAKTPELFSKLLPDAVALNVEKEWAKQFEGIDVSTSTSWYSGQSNFSAALFASTLSSGMSQAVGAASFSGSSGGGHVGGGGGGGGGGGW